MGQPEEHRKVDSSHHSGHLGGSRGEVPVGRNRTPLVLVLLSCLRGAFELRELDLDALASESAVLVLFVDSHTSGLPPVTKESANPRYEIVRAAAGETIEVGKVLLLGAGDELQVSNGRFEHAQNERASPPRLDALLAAIAREFGGQSVVIVFPGALGAVENATRHLKEHGAIVLGRSAFETATPPVAGLFDLVLPTDRISAATLEYVRQASLSIGDALRWADPQTDRVLSLVCGKTGHDFRHYKRSTIHRRLLRRLRLLGIDDVNVYLDLLSSDPREPERLVRDLVIRVTRFFRDAPVFAAIEQQVIPALFGGTPARESLRVWIPACATGEEAYSIALLLSEFVERRGLATKLRIFATDIDANALAVAREGSYSSAIEADVSGDRLARFFERVGDRYRVKPVLRDLIVFSKHDLVRDPPFSKLDLISCRNVLIYLSAELQSRLVHLLHYALAPEGLLVLGPGEGLGDRAKLFTVVDKQQRVFRRSANTATGILHLSKLSAPERAANTQPSTEAEPRNRLSALVERALLTHLAPACVVIDERHDAIYFYGRTGAYVNPPEGLPTKALFELLRLELRASVRDCLRDAAQRREASTCVVRTSNAAGAVRILAAPLAPAESGLYLVCFEDLPAAACPELDGPTPMHAAVEQLELELERKRRELYDTLESYESTNEALALTNEELRSMNEELQAANEELDLATELSRGQYAELQIVNAELRARVEQLEHDDAELRALLESADIGILLVDGELKFRSFTPAIRQLFNVISSDTGRPLSHVSRRFRHDSLETEILEVIRTAEPREATVWVDGVRACLLRIVPQRTDNGGSGALLTFSDVPAAPPDDD